MIRALAALALVSLAACATGGTMVTEDVVFKADEYTGQATLDGRNIMKMTAIGLGPSVYANVGATQPEAGSPWYVMLYTRVEHSDWLFLENAYAGGDSLDYRVRDRQVLSGSRIQEKGGIPLSADQLQRYAAEGLDVKLSGSRGAVTLQVPPERFAEMLTAIEAAPQ